MFDIAYCSARSPVMICMNSSSFLALPVINVMGTFLEAIAVVDVFIKPFLLSFVRDMFFLRLFLLIRCSFDVLTDLDADLA